MRLIKAKVRCVEGVRDSGWFVPGRGVTVVHGGKGSGKSALLKALEALNPIYDIEQRRPFANHPEVWHQGERIRRVIPEKKTAVVLVFSAEPQIVRKLDRIDPALIETDRIEVGRRLDYSRWIIFVEISSSTRWSEIVDDMTALARIQERISDGAAGDLSSLWEELKDLHPTDRVKGGIATTCTRWLHSLLPYLDEEKRDMAKECLFRVKRAERFKKAREKVRGWLPRVIMLSSRETLKKEYSFAAADGDREHTVLPILLENVRRTYAENRRDFKEHVQKLEAELEQQLPENISCPTIELEDERWVIGKVAEPESCANRIQLVSLAALCAELCYQRRPLLLLDQMVDDLDDQSAATMREWLQRFGDFTQLVLTTSQARVSSAGGWQTVKRIGSEGLSEIELESD